jgi:hypothetical protein
MKITAHRVPNDNAKRYGYCLLPNGTCEDFASQIALQFSGIIKCAPRDSSLRSRLGEFIRGV